MASFIYTSYCLQISANKRNLTRSDHPNHHKYISHVRKVRISCNSIKGGPQSPKIAKHKINVEQNRWFQRYQPTRLCMGGPTADVHIEDKLQPEVCGSGLFPSLYLTEWL